MLTDSMARQFLVHYRHILKIASIENDLGITGKSLQKWVVGRRPLPDKWEEPLLAYLYPMLDPLNSVHAGKYQIDNVVTLNQTNVLEKFQRLDKYELQKKHFDPLLTESADVIYFSFQNSSNKQGLIPVYSRYLDGDVNR